MPKFLLAVLLLALASVGPSRPVLAEAVAGLYEASVPVQAQDDAARDAGIPRAFEAVLVKVAGSRRVLQNPAVAGALREAPSRLVQFYFRSNSLPPDETGAVATELRLYASFQPAAVDDLLRRAGEPRLSPNRPGTIAWIAVDDGKGLRVLSRDADPALLAWIERAAAERGVPLLFPAMDLEESLAVTPERVAALEEAAVLEASTRYGAPGVLMARLLRSSTGEWLGEWSQRIGEESVYSQGQDATIAGIADKLVDSIAEALSNRFAVRANLDNAEELRIRVAGVRTLADFRALSAELSRLGSVREARPALIDGTTVHFDLVTDSGIDGVLQELGLLQRLRAAGDPAERRYDWSGG